MLYPVILCGGAGTRLWPASRADRPKQFLPLLGPLSSFQETLLRLEGLNGAAPIIVTGLAHKDQVLAQVAQLGIEVTVIIEPQARDSAPAVAAATAYVQQQDPDGIVLMLAADHHVRDVPGFSAAVIIGAAAARQGYIATFGITPDHPATGYGYIQPGAPVMPGVFAVAAFVEKPKIEIAKTYLAQNYVWNSGNFAFQAKTLMAEFEAFDPATAKAAKASVAKARRHDNQVFLDADAFEQTTKKSLDYAVMEKTAKAAVVPAAFGWSDLGAWDAIWEASDRDEAGNACIGDVQLINTHNSLVRANGIFVGVIGVDDLAIVAEADAVLICRRQDSQQVKALVDDLKAQGRPMALRHGVDVALRAGVQTVLTQGAVTVLRLDLDAGQSGQLPIGSYQILQGELTLNNGLSLKVGTQGHCDRPSDFTAQTPALILLTVWA